MKEVPADPQKRLFPHHGVGREVDQLKRFLAFGEGIGALLGPEACPGKLGQGAGAAGLQ